MSKSLDPCFKMPFAQSFNTSVYTLAYFRLCNKFCSSTCSVRAVVIFFLSLHQLAPPIPTIMPALLERPKLSNAMARALHKHIMRERERKRQEEEEVDKMMEQKLKEEEERKRKKEMEERMSLEETKEQIMKMGEKLQGLQEEKHQLFLQLKKVLHEEEKRRRKEQSDMTTLTSATYQPGNMAGHSGQHLLSMQASQVSHGRPGALLGERSKQLFQTPVIPGRHYQSQQGFSGGASEHGQYSGGQAAHGPYGVTQPQHASPFTSSQPVPVSYASSSQLRGASAFPGMPYLPHQQQGYAVPSHFVSQPGYIPSAAIPLQKQLEHANQQSGFTDSASFQSSPQPGPRSAYIAHSQSGQRFYHHSK
ncbi:hypothetical protein ACEWY4_009963 [Coilia grayii]|uniref:G protein pathway suppressor 2 n=1 Tax=Coilia grayii TaxID=363190 RepID=A0ABD1K832_9TELE